MKAHHLRYLLVVLVLALITSPCFAVKVKAEDWNVVPKSIVELKKIENQVEALVEKVSPAIVSIQIGKSRGTGIIVSGDGLVVTAAHVVKKPGTPAIVTTTDKKKYAGIALGTFSSTDAGMLKITTKRKDMPHVKLGDSGKIKPGTWCVAMGHPLGYKSDRTPVVRIGRVLLNQANVIQTDCPLISGDSGGPLFDLDGKLIGINSRIGMAPSMNFHVPIDVFKDNWNKLKKGDNFQTNLPLRSDKKIAKTFEPVVKKAAECVVQIRCEKRNKILGTIVGPDGWILTKASELKGRVICRLPDGRDLEAKIVGIDPNFDCAMLKVDALDLPNIPWGVKDPKRGQWIAVPGLDKKPLVYGVVGTARHTIPSTPGFLGIEMDSKVKNKVVIKKVVPKGPADKAGIKAGDIVTHIDGKPVKTSLGAIKLIKRKKPGQTLTVKVKRGSKTLELKVRLAQIVSAASRKRDILNASTIGLSKRRNGFPVVLQHDALLPPQKCGSPVVDLNGKVVGLNIARAGRTETYFVPSSVLFPMMYNLMSGRAHPRLGDAAKATPIPTIQVKPKLIIPKKPEPKKVEPKKTEPKKAEPKKVEPKKVEPKKVEPKKTEPKKTEPKKTEPKKTAPKKEVKPEPKKTVPKKAEPKKTAPKKAEPKKKVKPTPKKAETKKEAKPEAKKAEPQK